MPEFFPPSDFDGYDYLFESEGGEHNPQDFFLMSEDEFLSGDYIPPDEAPFIADFFPPLFPDEIDYSYILSGDDVIHDGASNARDVTVVNLRDIDPKELRRHVFPDAESALEWLKETKLWEIGQLVELGGGFYGIRIQGNTAPKRKKRRRKAKR